MTRQAPRSTLAWAAVLLPLLLSACASLPPGAQPNPADPWERMNRTTHRFNNTVDRAVLKPVATAYRDHVPQVVRTGIDNALENLGYPTVIANQFLQGKFFPALQDTGRFVLNSTFGLAGFIDVASRAGLEQHDEDFGQTLGRWGVPAGPYLEIPLMGPSTLRDTPARYVDSQTRADQLLEEEVTYFKTDAYQAGVITLTILNTRAELLTLDRLREQAFDEYAFVRDAWLQRREYAVRDGDVEEEPLEIYPDEEIGEEPASGEAAPEEEAPQPDAQPEDQPQPPQGESETGTATRPPPK